MEQQGPGPGVSSKGSNELNQTTFSRSGESRWITIISKQISKDKPQSLLFAPVSTGNYYAPLTSQINRLDKHVTFSLPHSHVDKNSANWRQQQTSRKNSLRLGVLNGSIPLAISDTGATASAFKPSEPSIPTGIKSNKTFG